LVDQADAESLFQDLFSSYYGIVLVTCRRRLGSLHDAEDATVEVFRIAWLKLREGRVLSLPWLYQTARNVVGNEYRRERRHKTLLRRAQSEAPDLSLEPDTSMDLKRALGRLKKSDRELLFMAYWEDLGSQEIAAILRVKEPTVRMRLSRAKALLRKQLRERPDATLEEVTSLG
jgi:RNA polymerase sigma-70 factor (ECF subfamily)